MAHRRVRGGPVDAPRAERRGVRASDGARLEQPEHRRDAHERGLVALTLHLHHLHRARGRGVGCRAAGVGQRQEGAHPRREAQPRRPRRLRAPVQNRRAAALSLSARVLPMPHDFSLSLNSYVRN